MRIKRFFLICTLPSIIVGCTGFLENQQPAPVYGDGTPLYGNRPLPENEQEQAQELPKETAKTAPLKNQPKVVKPEPLPIGEKLLTPAQEQELAALQNPEEIKPKPKPKTAPKVEPVVEETAVVEDAPVAPAPPPPAFKPLESFSSASPAVTSLVLAANEDTEKGNVTAATNTLERASRIEPRNAALYYKLALLKLKTNPSEAEDLAKKSALLASNDSSLKKHSWLLVAKARELQKNSQGAEEARAKASKY